MNIKLIYNDDYVTLMAKGVHSAEEMVNAAIEANEIEIESKQRYLKGEYSLTYMRATPRKGYEYYYNTTDGPGRGAFKVSLITL